MMLHHTYNNLYQILVPIYLGIMHRGRDVIFLNPGLLHCFAKLYILYISSNMSIDCAYAFSLPLIRTFSRVVNRHEAYNACLGGWRATDKDFLHGFWVKADSSQNSQQIYSNIAINNQKIEIFYCFNGAKLKLLTAEN